MNYTSQIMYKFLLVFLLVSTSSLECETLSQTKKMTNSAVVFMYHRFAEPKFPSTNITMEQFEFHLDYLHKNNYNVWSLSKIVKHIIEKKPLPPKTVALTIDDAYLSIYTHAYPKLKELNYPFTVFVNTDPVDKKYESFMNWDQMREMQKNGARFANHSLSHDYMIPREGEDESMWKNRITKEVKQAQQRLNEELGESEKSYPKLFSYPFGEYSMQTASLIKDMGYVGISQTSGPIGMDSDLKELARFAMNETYAGEKSFITKLNTLPMPMYSAEPKEHILDKNNPPKLKIRLKKRLNNMRCYLSNGELLETKWISKTDIEVYSKEPLSPPRDRYTCTAQVGKGVYYWYSHLWIIQQ